MSIRRMREGEMEKVAKQMLDIFFDEIDISTVVKGINPDTARALVYENLYEDVAYFYKYGEIFVYDDNISGMVFVIDGKRFSIIKKIWMSLKSNKKMLKIATKDELKIMNKNAKKINELHSFNWYKKRKNIPFYLAHLGIDKEKRSQGICREMLEYVFDYTKQYNHEIVLETFNPKNVQIYEHFGFEIVKITESKDIELKQYRMIKNCS